MAACLKSFIEMFRFSCNSSMVMLLANGRPRKPAPVKNALMCRSVFQR